MPAPSDKEGRNAASGRNWGYNSAPVHPTPFAMAQKPKTVFRLLTEKPWWFSAGLALLVYAVLAFLLPMFEFQNPAGKGLAHGLTNLAPLFALVFIVPAVISAYRAWKKRGEKK